MVWLTDGEKKFEDMFSRFDRIPAFGRQDGQTSQQHNNNNNNNNNKCIGDDTKAAARQRLNCIKNKK